MKNVFTFLVVYLISALPLTAQNNGDEQGMEIPETLQLQQDKEALEKALDGWWNVSRKNINERMSWYSEAKFGCFVHWGVYSVPAGIWNGKMYKGYSEHLMRQAQIPINKYQEELVKPFNPTGFDAETWMKHAYEAGMKYFIITAKHHDGFAMYFSEAYPYDMSLTLYNKDPMRELREAARKYGIKFGFYYSHAFDWEHPDAPGNDWVYPSHPGGDKLIGGRDWWLERPDFIAHATKYVDEKAIPQIKELIRNYDPDILWFDTPHKLPFFENIRILEAIRESDPENKIVVNGRLARYSGINLGDYINTGDRAAFFYPVKGYWESIPTTNNSYGYSVVDTIHKPVSHFIRLLASAASKGGNILMNVGPMGNGKWNDRDVDIFKGVGDWLKIYGEAIYGNEKTDIPVPQWGVTTQKNDIIYAHVYDWPKNGKLVVGGLTSGIANVWIVSDKQKTPLMFSHINDKDLEITLPFIAPDTTNTVIALQVKSKKPAYPVRLLDSGKSNTLLTFDAQLVGNGLEYGDGKTYRNYVTNWISREQYMKWNLRVHEPVKYNVYVDYNTSGKEDSGTVIIEIAGKTFEAAYIPFTEDKGQNRIYIGDIELEKGEFECRLKGKDYKGSQYMRPIAIYLEKR